VTEVKQATQKEVDLFAAQKEISREKARKALVDAGYIIVP
jgi:NACalpha-BTF3-like transcription factor